MLIQSLEIIRMLSEKGRSTVAEILILCRLVEGIKSKNLQAVITFC